MSQAGGSTQMRHMLPEYVQGRLTEAERGQLEVLLAKDPALRAELDWIRSLAQEVKATAAAPPAGNRAWERLQSRIAAEKEQAGNQSNVIPLRPKGREATAAGRKWQVLLAVAATVLVVQGVTIGVLMQDQPTRHGPLAPLSGQPTVMQGRVLQVVFTPQATESQIRAALQAVQGQLVGGPGGLGIYQVVVPMEFPQPLETLQKATGVESVSMAPGR